jgi:ribosomal protein S6--L-glutamate ligase
MAEYYLSMNHLVPLEENLPNLAPIDDPVVARLIRCARGVVMPRGATEKRYRKITAMAQDWFPNLDFRYAYPGKTTQARLFGRLNVRHPRTIVYPNSQSLWDALRQALPLDYPFVLKGDTGGGGSGVFPVTSRNELLNGLARLPVEEPILIQRWVEHGGMDLRVVVIGARMVSYFRVGGGNFYNNVCRGGRIHLEIFPELQYSGMAAVARFCHLTGINLAGFDLMFPDDGPPVFIEINYNFGRKGLGGTPGFRRLFRAAVGLWQQGVAYPSMKPRGMIG